MADLRSFPLCWPDGWKRTAGLHRNHGRFTKNNKWATIAEGVGRVILELERLGIKRDDLIISTNVPTRIDGLPRGDAGNPSDPGVAVYWRKGQNAPMKCMATDRYHGVADNLCGIAATLEAMRAIERHGGAEILERAFRGFAALPQTATRPWREVMTIEGRATPEIIEQRYKALARIHHPDAGGSHDAMAELNAARDAALLEVR